MQTLTCFLVLLAAVAGSGVEAHAQEHRVSVPPRLSTIGSVDKQQGELNLINHTVTFVFEPDANGQKHRKPVFETEGDTIPLASAEVYDASGKKLTDDEILERATVGAVVAVSATGDQVDPVYLRALAKDTLVIVSPYYAVNHVTQRVFHGAPPASPPVYGARLEPIHP